MAPDNNHSEQHKHHIQNLLPHYELVFTLPPPELQHEQGTNVTLLIY